MHELLAAKKAVVLEHVKHAVAEVQVTHGMTQGEHRLPLIK